MFGYARALVVLLSEDIRCHIRSNRALGMHLSLVGDILCSMGFGHMWLTDSVHHAPCFIAMCFAKWSRQQVILTFARLRMKQGAPRKGSWKAATTDCGAEKLGARVGRCSCRNGSLSKGLQTEGFLEPTGRLLAVGISYIPYSYSIIIYYLKGYIYIY